MMNRKKVYILAFSMASISLLIGCTDLKNNLYLENKSYISTTELLNIVDKKEFSNYKNTLTEFNLGSKVLGENEEAVKVDLKGLIGVPNNLTNAPIVFIVTGNNNSIADKEMSIENLTYQGFDYLVDALSKAGFLTVAINTDIVVDKSKENYIVEDKILNLVFEKHVEYLKDAIEGKDNKYPVSLYKKGDLENIGLMGQSSTGRTIYNIANQQSLNNLGDIKGLLSITPHDGTPILSYPDIPSSILSVEHSTDTNIGFDMYNNMEKIDNRESFCQLTYLIGGDSDKFNNLVIEDVFSQSNSVNSDLSVSSRTSASVNEDTIQDEFSHKEFLSYYTIDFFDYVLKGKKENSLYDTKNATIQKLYKKDILSKLFTKDRVQIFNASNIESNISFKNIKTKDVIESSIASLDTAINFNEPATNIELKLLQLDWKESNSSIEINMENMNNNFEGFNSISIEWALNHASELNIDDLNKISIILEDKNNKSEVILLDELALNKIVGISESTTTDNKGTSNWSRFTPISETRVPLELFEGINLENINKIYINLGDNKTGSIYLKNIYLNK